MSLVFRRHLDNDLLSRSDFHLECQQCQEGHIEYAGHTAAPELLSAPTERPFENSLLFSSSQSRVQEVSRFKVEAIYNSALSVSTIDTVANAKVCLRLILARSTAQPSSSYWELFIVQMGRDIFGVFTGWIIYFSLRATQLSDRWRFTVQEIWRIERGYSTTVSLQNKLRRS